LKPAQTWHEVAVGDEVGIEVNTGMGRWQVAAKDAFASLGGVEGSPFCGVIHNWARTMGSTGSTGGLNGTRT